MLEFGINSVVISIDWIQSQNHGNNNDNIIIAYSITAVPQVIVMFNNTTSAQLQLIGITATLCGFSNATTIYIVTLHYGESFPLN